ncbi:MAG: hypothetical protein WD850_03500 [Candidatus Spechtbacterales bacterium]
MKHLSCKNVSGKDCDYVAQGEAGQETKQQLIEHGRQTHPELLEGVSEEEMAQMGQKMDEVMEDTEA